MKPGVASSALDDLVGRSVGEYVLRERIGEGGFGVVYRATQKALDREAVVKLLHKRLRGDVTGTERFLREAKLASKLDHPYAAHVYGFGVEPDGALWIAMELVRGTTLDEILRLQGPMAIERFVPLLDRICEVVHTAHEQGIVHRDLKPANVMVLARAGRLLPKLLDFGIAKTLVADVTPDMAATVRVDEAALPTSVTTPLGDAVTVSTPSGSPLTQRGAVMGSPLYMAPEQWHDAAGVDARTDLYALGVLAYQALTGRTPFSGATIGQMMRAHAEQPVPPVGARLPPALDDVFARVLAKRSADRYPDALAFAEAFRQASGLAAEAPSLPAIDQDVRESAIANAPQPIAEAVAAIEAARNAHQARDAQWQLARTVARYLGLVAIASRSRTGGRADPAAAAETMRALVRRALDDSEWIALGRELTRGWIQRRDAHPVPELVDFFHGAGAKTAPGVGLDDLIALRSEAGAVIDDDALRAAVGRGARAATQLLRAIEFVHHYPLVVPIGDGIAERWMGARRSQRPTALVRGKGLEPGAPSLLDEGGAPVLSLAPVCQIAPPAPGAPVELFLFDGRGRHGAKLVAWPAAFEHHDDKLFDWFRMQLASSLDDTDRPADDERPPYRGLHSFSSDDGALFVGREQLVDAVTNRMRVQSLLVVVGRSGAGKSSLVHAGLVPALPTGWRTITLRPGPAPLATLGARLAHAEIADGANLDHHAGSSVGDRLRTDAAARGPILLVVDQLEELFTLCGDPAEREAFAAAIAGAARSTDDPVRVVVTLRDDFLVRAEQLTALRNRIGQSLQLVTVPAAADLVRIIVEPARRAGYDFDDPELAGEMVREVADQPGALALLSFTAARLWEHRDRHFKQLTRAAYRALGGVGGALAQHAEHTLDAMPVEERRLAREAFRHLVTSENTRAVLERDELVQSLGGGSHADGVVEKLVAARLLVASENEAGRDTVEIVHEALLVAWPRLVEWVREDVEGARLREQLRSAARQWHDRGRPRGLLWRGDAVADLARWRARDHVALADIEAAFADTSTRDAARGRKIRRGILIAAFAALVGVVVVLTSINAEKTAARSALATQVVRLNQEHGRQRFVDDQPIHAALYLAEARRRGGSGASLDYLADRTERIVAKYRFDLAGHTGVVRGAFFDRGRIFTFGEDGTARSWDAATGAALATFAGHSRRILDAVASPDGSLLVTTSMDETARIWDVASGAQRHVLAGHTDWVWTASFAPAGDRIITGGIDGAVRVWRVTDGVMIAMLDGHVDGVTDVAYVDASQIVTAGVDGDVVRWDAATGTRIAVIEHHSGPVIDMAVSPTGAVVSASEDGVVAWHAGDQRRGIDLETGGQIAISGDGETVAVAVDNKLAVWHPRTDLIVFLAGPRAHTTDVAFSPDGRRVAASSSDATGRIWELASGFQEAIIASPSAIDSIAFSPDGTRVVISGAHPAVWDSRPDVLVASYALPGVVQSVGLGGGGDVVVATARIEECGDAKTPCGFVKAWTIGGEVAFEMSHPVAPNHAALSRDGSRLALSADDGVTLWDVTSGALVATLSGADEQPMWVAFDPSGDRLLSTYRHGDVRVWNGRSGARLRTLRHGNQAKQATWSNDGRIGSCGREALVWDETEKPRRFEIEAPCDRVAFDRDGRIAIAAGSIVQTWEPGASTPQWRLDNRYRVHEVAFAGDGLMLLADERALTIWDRINHRVLDSFRVSAIYGTFDLDVVRGVMVVGDGEHVHVIRLARAPSVEVERVIDRLPMLMERGVPIVKPAQVRNF